VQKTIYSCTALALALAGCKLSRANVRSGSDETPARKVFTPRTVRGSFLMNYEPSTGKRYPVHMTFQVDFSADATNGLLSTCVDSDGGLSKIDGMAKVVPDKDVPVTMAGKSDAGAQAIKPSPLHCHKEEPLQARVQAASGALASATTRDTVVARLADTAPGTTGNTPTTTAAANKSAPEGTTATNAGTTSITGNATTAAPPGSYVFISKADTKGNTLRFTLRANDAGWQVEDINYYGVPGWMEGTTTVAMSDK